MRDLSTFGKIYLAVQPVDFRKHAHGLALLVKGAFGIRLDSDKSLFAFTNRTKTAVKILYWDNTGYALWWKGLEKEKFKWPKNEADIKSIQAKELKWLLEGVDLNKIKTHTKISVDSIAE